jgi:hypothetical protein
MYICSVCYMFIQYFYKLTSPDLYSGSNMCEFDGWFVKQFVKVTLNNSLAWMCSAMAYHFLEQCVGISSWNYHFQQYTQGLLFKGRSVCQSNETVEAVNMIVCC